MQRIAMNILLAIAASSTPAIAENSKIALYERAVAAELRDPESARFRFVRIVKSDEPKSEGLCGEINAKNGYGGYTGWQPFFASVTPVGRTAIAVVWFAERHSYTSIAEKCR